MKTKKYHIEMKKSSLILAVAFAAGFLTTSTIKAIQPTQITGLMLSVNKEMVLEEEIILQKWMYTPEMFASHGVEANLELSSWMIETDGWKNTSDQLSEESELEVEDWMITRFDTDNRTIALEDWMTRITG